MTKNFAKSLTYGRSRSTTQLYQHRFARDRDCRCGDWLTIPCIKNRAQMDMRYRTFNCWNDVGPLRNNLRLASLLSLKLKT